eukprot:3933699-Rhodomonas_salina.1
MAARSERAADNAMPWRILDESRTNAPPVSKPWCSTRPLRSTRSEEVFRPSSPRSRYSKHSANFPPPPGPRNRHTAQRIQYGRRMNSPTARTHCLRSRNVSARHQAGSEAAADSRNNQGD